MKQINCLFFLIAFHTASSQTAIFNTSDSLYRIDDIKTGALTNLGAYCDLGLSPSRKFLSTAIYKDTLYFIPRDEGLDVYAAHLNNLTNCRKIMRFPGDDPVIGFAADKDGILYAMNRNARLESRVFMYNPYTQIINDFGLARFPVGGDIIFYGGKIIYAATSHIYELDLNDPYNGTKMFMFSNPYDFYGLISIPGTCDENKYYGLAARSGNTDFVELDMKNRKIGAVVSTVPYLVYDGASNADNGNTLGIKIDALKIDTPCGTQKLATINIAASSLNPGNITYRLDNTITNTSGVFTNVSAGTHTVNLANTSGCSTDSTFSFLNGILSPISIVTTVDCNKSTRDITVNGTSSYSPVLYSLNGSPFQNSNQFQNLQAGIQHISAKDASGCQVDSVFNLLINPNDKRCINVYVPNSFTPNGDGLNDILKPIAYSLKALEYFAVFSRYGEKVFLTNNSQNGWDGKINGKEQNAGSFVWVLEGVNRYGEKVKLKGTVLLIR